jgi:hypothetical protein
MISHLTRHVKSNTAQISAVKFLNMKYIHETTTDAVILSRVSVTKKRVWISESVYCIFTSRNYN